jgi:hypothetical protein
MTTSEAIRRAISSDFGARCMRCIVSGVVMCWLSACVPSQVPSQQVSEVARDLNVATRFGRMDVAVEHTAEAHRSDFLKHRAAWGNEVRVMDVEFAQLDMQASDKANVLVDISWMRMNEGLLRSTRLKQNWHNPGGGWKLEGEERVAGDLGLLGENVTVLRPEAQPDVPFPTKTIR